MNERLLVFDLDGTLFDTSPEITAAVTAAAGAEGIEVMSDPSRLRSYMGNGLSRFVKRVITGERWGEPPKEKHQRILELTMENYASNFLSRNSLYPKVEDTLARLEAAGHLLAVATNKLERFTLPMLAKFLASIEFACVACKDTVARPKPDPAPLLQILRKLGVQGRDAAIIGDSTIDIEAGRAAGFGRAIAVSYGYHQGDDVAGLGADHVIDDMGALPAIVAKAG